MHSLWPRIAALVLCIVSCMIEGLQETIRSALAELKEARSEIKSLTSRVRALEIQLEGFTEVSSLQEELREETAKVPVSRGYPESGLGSNSASAGSGGIEIAAEGGQTWEERERICKDIGYFLRRSLGEDYRGYSGRQKIKQASRFYVIVRDFAGVLYDPPKVVSRFSEVKSLCIPHGEAGTSIFVGLPSKREVLCTLKAGHFVIPEVIPDA